MRENQNCETSDEIKLSNTAFLYAYTLDIATIKANSDNFIASKPSSTASFRGIKLNTGANLSSLISDEQHMTYCSMYCQKATITLTETCMVKVIGGAFVPIGTSTISITFKNFGSYCHS